MDAKVGGWVVTPRIGKPVEIDGLWYNALDAKRRPQEPFTRGNEIGGDEAMKQTERYDGIVIGAGQAGAPLSRALAQAGWKTALVEREHVGGTCINEGCTPTKTMVASARVAYVARRAAGYGIHTGPVTVDMARVRERKRNIVQSRRSGSQRRLETTEGLDLLMGEARFTGPHSVEVQLNVDNKHPGGEIRHLAADSIFINTGARPRRPSLPGLDRVPVLDSTSIMELDLVPEHLLVLGGGYVGLEFGQMFRRFGSQVTIVQRRGQLLTREDPDVAEEVANILREDGIEVLLDTHALGVEQAAEGAAEGGIQLTVRTPEGERTLSGSHLLAAAGRVPDTEHLNLAATARRPGRGVQTDARGFIQVNERLETGAPGVYALGDVKGGPAFTHISYDDFRIIRTNLLEDGDATTTGRLVPYTVFIDPQLGRVGLSEREARAQGRNVRVAKLPMNYVARALEVDEPRGFMKAIVDADSGQILGAAVLGIEGGEVMAILQMAMMGHVPYTAIRDAVLAHPTLAEALNNLFMTLDG
jgi:pyruvate/2-oxoglutarate dehydrogenase complex dihydrolipoamide dehydrogenase (E3) component